MHHRRYRGQESMTKRLLEVIRSVRPIAVPTPDLVAVASEYTTSPNVRAITWAAMLVLEHWGMVVREKVGGIAYWREKT